MPEMTPAELRLAIARAKGWKKEYGRMDAASRAPHEYYIKPDGTLAMYPPDWPADITAAWELVEEMRQDCSISVHIFCEFNKYAVTLQPDGDEFEAEDCIFSESETAPIAICRAWLAWKGLDNAR